MSLDLDSCVSRLSGTTVYISKQKHSGSGLGRDTEQRFGIDENNRPGADHQESGTEFKASVDNSCYLTILTNNPKINYRASRPREAAVRTLTETFAVPTPEEGRNNLYFTFKYNKSTSIGDHQGSLKLTSDHLIVHINGIDYCGWNREALDVALKKADRLMHAKGASEPISKKDPRWANIRDNEELREGRYTEVTLYEGFSSKRFWDAFEQGYVVVDLRAYSRVVEGKPRPKIRDHGTAFRIHPVNLKMLYDNPPQSKVI